MKNDEDKNPLNKYEPAMSLGINMVAGMTGFTYIGYRVGQKLNQPIWTLIGIFLGLFYCGYEVWKLIRRMDE